MKLKKVSVWFVVLVFILAQAPLVSAADVNETAADQETIGISYRAHVQNLGYIPVPEDSFVTGPEAVGSSGQGLRLEALWIELTGDLPDGAGISYQVHVQNKGWMDPVDNGQLAGTTGESLQIEAIRISLTNLDDYDVYYRGHVQNQGNLPQTNDEWGWVKNGETLGTTGESLRLEQIEIKIEKHDDSQADKSSTVILADGSYGTADDGQITDLPAAKYLFKSGDTWYCPYMDTLIESEDSLDMAIGDLYLDNPNSTITSISGLTNGQTYDVYQVVSYDMYHLEVDFSKNIIYDVSKMDESPIYLEASDSVQTVYIYTGNLNACEYQNELIANQVFGSTCYYFKTDSGASGGVKITANPNDTNIRLDFPDTKGSFETMLYTN